MVHAPDKGQNSTLQCTNKSRILAHMIRTGFLCAILIWQGSCSTSAADTALSDSGVDNVLTSGGSAKKTSTRNIRDIRNLSSASLQSIVPVKGAVNEDWQEWPLREGTWALRIGANNVASFLANDSQQRLFGLACTSTTKSLSFTIYDVPANADTFGFATTFANRSFDLEANRSGAVTSNPVSFDIDPNNETLDEIIFSRGSFGVVAGDKPPFRIPTSAEFARVVEDCRD